MPNFTFSAIYKNGNKVTLSETLSYDHLDRKNIEFMEVLKDDQPFLLMKLEDGDKLIYRKRVQKTMGYEDFVVYLLGWHRDGFQSINYISQDGTVVQGGKWNENDSWMYAPKLREYEV
jgi:hypothetical protein